ncbi:unnamed protein product [Ostreobium quekettii]|uniref:Telomeric single stranded DNA binding POT1/Cdc13 domain-containing protein n=1 Tax=Ostreobium quekettii TaxID=121088 RepID=A0A8S1ISK6_9CHLO|nr:unnamed protein product [Ostreobium quekettii]|eukprot:evm.model.scf_2220.1 EVM.evm.TU.scf_2220.1   scf_2220:13987-15624(+)
MAQPAYQYLDLAQATAVPRRVVNIFAVVVAFTPPKDTQGTDMCCQLRVLDPSIDPDDGGGDMDDSDPGVTLVAFCADQARLPVPRRLGDVIRLHRAKSQQFEGHPQLMGKVGKGLEFCLYDGRIGDTLAPYAMSSASHTPDADAELGLIRALRRFAAKKVPGVEMARARYGKMIRGLHPGLGGAGYLECKVVLVEGSERNEVIWVWDGTDAKPLPFVDAGVGTGEGGEEGNGNLEGDGHQGTNGGSMNGCREVAAAGQGMGVGRKRGRGSMGAGGSGPGSGAQVEESARKRVALSWQVHKNMPELGTLLPVHVAVRPEVGLPLVGQMVKFKKLEVVSARGQLAAVFNEASGWVYCRTNPQLLHQYADREEGDKQSEWVPERTRLAGTTTRVDLPLSPLRNVLRSLADGQQASFRCVVRCLQFRPRDPLAICRNLRSYEAGPSNRDDSAAFEPSWTFAFGLHLEDPTGEVDGLVYGPHGVEFFGEGPGDLGGNPSLRGHVVGVLERLCGGNQYGAVWLECCLETHCIDSKPFVLIRDTTVVDTGPS